jgi:hypothetical protein
MTVGTLLALTGGPCLACSAALDVIGVRKNSGMLHELWLSRPVRPLQYCTALPVLPTVAITHIMEHCS